MKEKEGKSKQQKSRKVEVGCADKKWKENQQKYDW